LQAVKGSWLEFGHMIMRAEMQHSNP
jgi:hypothetical protein